MIRMTGDLVLIKRVPPVTQVGSILLAPAAEEELLEGTIVAAGPGKQMNGWVRKMSVSVGDRVLFSKHGHMPVKLNGEDFTCLREDGIVCTLDS